MTDEPDYSGAREFDDLHDQDEATLLAIRKFLHGVAGTEAETDVGPMEAAQRALHRFDHLIEENERLREQLAETEQRANQALGVAQSTGGSNGGTSKVDEARHAARNEVVKRALLDTSASSGGGVTVADVQAMLRPEHDVAY